MIRDRLDSAVTPSTDPRASLAGRYASGERRGGTITDDIMRLFAAPRWSPTAEILSPGSIADSPFAWLCQIE